MPPYWFVFDLDETLTHMNPYFNVICSFFTDRGFVCRELTGSPMFPAKIMAARCGI